MTTKVNKVKRWYYEWYDGTYQVLTKRLPKHVSRNLNITEYRAEITLTIPHTPKRPVSKSK